MVRIEVDGPCPLPDDPLLAEAAVMVRDSDDWGLVVDARWRQVYCSDQARLTDAGGGHMAATVIGEHVFGPEWVKVRAEARFSGVELPALVRESFLAVGGHMLADTPGGKGQLRDLVDPSLRDVVDELTPSDASALTFRLRGLGLDGTHELSMTAVRIRDEDGLLHGAVVLLKPAVPMDTLMQLSFQRDLEHLEGMFAMSSARRRAGAVLFADLESSSVLARRLSTGSYFALVRRLIRVTDQCIVDAGGLVGRHVGDGVVAFFPAEHFASESAAARACIAAARAIRTGLPEVAQRGELAADDVVARFGLHWGSTLFMGAITTAARTEVTALGDEANETARIEACATGGRTLASKQLVERLDDVDAAALDIDLDQLIYRPLADLDAATEKVRRDAPAIAVCDV